VTRRDLARVRVPRSSSTDSRGATAAVAQMTRRNNKFHGHNCSSPDASLPPSQSELTTQHFRHPGDEVTRQRVDRCLSDRPRSTVGHADSWPGCIAYQRTSAEPRRRLSSTTDRTSPELAPGHSASSSSSNNNNSNYNKRMAPASMLPFIQRSRTKLLSCRRNAR